MVEGPGTTRNSHKASQLINSKVLHISTTHPSHNAWWTNRKLSQVIKIGKELFLVFSLHQESQSDQDLAIRLHFGMSGSLQVNNRTTATSNTPRPTTTNYHGHMATLEITFDTKILRTYQTTISTAISAKGPRAKFAKLSTHDVCNPTFNIHNVLDQLQPQSPTNTSTLTISKDTLISDVLLNQNILPGIGNVIKVEGLHEARIHPKRTLSSLSREELRNVIICCKEYAMKWLNTGRAPAKYVYNQTICGSCAGTSIAICRVGGTNRTTFWCIVCTKSNATANANSNFNFNSDEKNPSRAITSTSISNSNSPSSSSNVLTDQSTNMHQTTCTRNKNMIRKACSTHGPSTIILRRCRKKGINEQRIFYTCKVRNCNYFHWADANFPRCTCDKRAVLRVSKTDKTGGRWFYFCARRGDKVSGCGYFQWAEGKDLDRYGHLLTPLL